MVEGYTKMLDGAEMPRHRFVDQDVVTIEGSTMASKANEGFKWLKGMELSARLGCWPGHNAAPSWRYSSQTTLELEHEKGQLSINMHCISGFTCIGARMV